MAQNQNSLGLAGPFASVLEAPYQQGQTYQSTAPKTVSGYGGAGEAISMFADKFLEGASRGRRMAFERSENRRQQSLNAIGAAIRDVQNADIPDALKQQKMAELQKVQLTMIAGDHGLDGEGSKGKKGKGDRNENPILGAIKHIAAGMLGPGAQPQPVSTDQLQATIGDVYSFLRDPNNSIEAQVKKADTGIMQVYGQMQAENKGKPLTWEQLSTNPKFQQAASAAMTITGKPTPGLQMIQQAAQEEQARQDPLYRMHLEEGQAQIDRNRALAQRDMAATQSLFKNEKGETIRFDATAGKYYDTANHEIPANDPRLNNLSKIGQERMARVVTKLNESDGIVYKFDPYTGQSLGPLTVNGRPVHQTSPLGRMAVTQGYIDDRYLTSRIDSINGRYDAEIQRAEMSKLPQSKKDEQIANINMRRDQELGLVQSRPPGSRRPGSTATPPGGKKAADQSANEDAMFGQFMQQMFGGSSGGGQQAPSAGASNADAL